MSIEKQLLELDKQRDKLLYEEKRRNETIALYKEMYENKVFKHTNKKVGITSITFNKVTNFRYDEKYSSYSNGIVCNVEKVEASHSPRYKRNHLDYSISESTSINSLWTTSWESSTENEFQTVKTLVTEVIKDIPMKLLELKPLEINHLERATISKTNLDFPHLVLDKDDLWYVRDSPFWYGDIYILSKNSVKWIKDTASREHEKDSFNSSLLADAGYRNRHTRGNDYDRVADKIEKAFKKTL